MGAGSSTGIQRLEQFLQLPKGDFTQCTDITCSTIGIHILLDKFYITRRLVFLIMSFMMESPTHRQFNFSLYLTPTKNQKYLEMSPDAYLQSSPVKKKVSAIRQIVPDADRLTESKVEFVHRPVPGSNMAKYQSRVVMADGRILAKVAVEPPTKNNFDEILSQLKRQDEKFRIYRAATTASAPLTMS